MSNRIELLKDMGWSDELIQHYFVENSEHDYYVDESISTSVYDTNTVTFTIKSTVVEE